MHIVEFLKNIDKNITNMSGGTGGGIASAPVTGAKTITATAAEVFAGASRLANRSKMAIHNTGENTVYWGGAGVTAANGFPLLPSDAVVFQFDKNTVTPLYLVSGSNNEVRVVEWL